MFKDFGGGDSGRDRPDQSGNTFRGTNAWMFPSGIGPRPPFQAMGITGLPQKKLLTFTVFRGSDNFTRFCFSFDDGTVYLSLTTAGSAASSAGTVTPIPTAAANFGSEVYFVSNNGTGGAKINGAGTLTAIAAMPQGYLIVRYGDQAAVMTSAAANTIRWSDTLDFTTWPAANTNPIGDPQAVVAMYSQRNSLVLPKVGGDIYVYTGVLGVNETLRRVDAGVRHLTPSEGSGAVVSQSGLWYPSNQLLGNFTGAVIVPTTRPDVPLKALYSTNPWFNNPGSIAPCIRSDEFLLIGTYDLLSNANAKNIWFAAHRPDVGGWTRHIVPVTDYVVTGAGVSTGVACVKVANFAHDGVPYFCTLSDTSGNGGRAPGAYGIFTEQEYPLVPNSTFYSGTAGTTTLLDGDSGAPVVATLAVEEWDAAAENITVKTIIVDYSYAPGFTPLATYNKFDISVEAVQTAGSETVRRSGITTFTPLGTGSTPDGSPLVRGQARFQVGDQGPGIGFRIRLDDWRGIIVHRLSAVVDEAPARV